MGKASERYLQLHKRLQSVDGMASHEATKWLVVNAPDVHRDYIEEYNEEHNERWQIERKRIEAAAQREREKRNPRKSA